MIDRAPRIAHVGHVAARWTAVAGMLLLSACATAPVAPFTVNVPADVADGRGRFTEIYCAVLEQHGADLPDNRSCEEALSHVASSPPGTGQPVDLGPSRLRLAARTVSGIGYACLEEWLQAPTTPRDQLAKFGYDMQMVEVDALSGTAKNAGQIRDAIMSMPQPAGPPNVVLLGYSKGAADALDAVVRYPELQQRVVALVSIAGAVGGSPLANDAKQQDAEFFRHWPHATCDSGDGGAVESLRPDVRKAWLAGNKLPSGIRYYSVVTLPDRERISLAVEPSYKKLAKVDVRNDGQVIYYDQIIPGSTLVGFLNADHWAVGVPIGRAHDVIGSAVVNHNDYPREALLEALMRYVEEDLSAARR